MTVLSQMLEKYDSTTAEGAANGLREVMQEIALAGLYRGGFFEKAAFYGGTCLRIFYSLRVNTPPLAASKEKNPQIPRCLRRGSLSFAPIFRRP